jgi:uncharacterized membrane protein YraQ (UPF0718 family)
MRSLSEVVDIFKCCIFNWGALTTILPAFIIAGAVIAFVPSNSVTRYLGAGAKKYISYPIAALSGALLPACSCNIVPLFASILKQGAGVGPAFTFLYAGPAINIISAIFTFKVIDPILGTWRIIGIFSISIPLGMIMEMFFHDKEASEIHSQEDLAAEKIDTVRLFLLFALLFAILIVGSSLVPSALAPPLNKTQFVARLSAFFGLVFSLLLLIASRFRKAELLDWLKQTYQLLKTIVPLFILTILIIGLIAKYIDIRWIHNLLSAKKDALGNRLFLPTLQSTFFGTIFGELMYFPILSEVVFTKAFLKLGMDIGPALAMLLAGPGTSLPGFILISRFVSWKKVSFYFVISVILETTLATLVAMSIGDYICACLNLK